MGNEEEPKTKGHRGAVIKASILVIFILAAIYVVRYTPSRNS